MVRRLTVFGLVVGAKKKHGLPEKVTVFQYDATVNLVMSL
jgi:hypothetical protein